MHSLIPVVLLALLFRFGKGQELDVDVDADVDVDGIGDADGDDLEGLYSTNEIELDPSKHDDQFFKFVTRPDLDAPRWDITTYNKSAVAAGYYFLAPYGAVKQHSKHSYVAPYIYDSEGELVWSGAELFKSFNTFTFKVSQFEDKRMLSLLDFQKGKGHVIDQSYREKTVIQIGGNGFRSNMHEFRIVDRGTKALYLTTKGGLSLANAQEAEYEGGPCRLVAQRIEERDIHTGEVTFEWAAKGRITPQESILYEHDVAELCAPGQKGLDTGADYMHANSVDKLPDGNYLLSARHTDTIYLITKEGELKWRLGGKNSNFTLPEHVHWSGQHDVRFRSQNRTHMILTLFDNAYRPGFPSTTNPYSRGLVLAVNTEAMTADVVMAYPHPGKEHSWERGNFQTLPNGNPLIFWTSDCFNTEFTADGQLIKTARLLSGLKTYRGYKFDWEGHPAENPVVHSQVHMVGGQVSTVVHVSWNGATRVTSWNLYETDQDNGNRTLLLGVQKIGFETTLVHPGYAQYVFVEAVDRLGRILRQTIPYTTLDPTEESTKTALALEIESMRANPPASLYSSPMSSAHDTDSPQASYRMSVLGGLVLCILGLWLARNARKFVWGWMQQRREWMYRPLKSVEMSEEP